MTTPATSATATDSPTLSATPAPATAKPIVYPFAPVAPTLICGDPAHVVIHAAANVWFALDSVPGDAGDYIAPAGVHVVMAGSILGPSHMRTWTVVTKTCPVHAQHAPAQRPSASSAPAVAAPSPAGRVSAPSTSTPAPSASASVTPPPRHTVKHAAPHVAPPASATASTVQALAARPVADTHPLSHSDTPMAGLAIGVAVFVAAGATLARKIARR